MDKKTLLDKTAKSEEERLLLARVLDRYEQCRARNIPSHTGFLSPAEQAACEDLLHAALIREGWLFTGGYAEAERKVLCFLPDWQEEAESGIVFLRAAYHGSEKPSHRDILGSLMGLSLTREKIGDILVGDAAADVAVSEEVADYLLREWTGAGRIRLSVAQTDAPDVPARSVKEIRDTVMSLRLDAVTASGFSMSRTRASELIRAGKVQKNYRDCLKPDAPVAEGDVISARGLGKFELAEVGGQSKKGRTALLLRRYQ